MLEQIRVDPRRLRSIEVLTGQAFTLLAQDGTNDDLERIESFTSDESLFIRSMAKNQAKIDCRLRPRHKKPLTRQHL